MAQLSVLVVDGDEGSGEFLCDLLPQSGCDLERVRSGREALAAIKAKRFHVLLIDAILPEGDGIELFRKLQAGHDCPAAILVARGRTFDQLRKAVDAGMWDVVAKPLDAASLIPRLEEAAGVYA